MINPTYSDLKDPRKPLKTDNLESHGIAAPTNCSMSGAVMKKVFGTSPNNGNMKLFFKNETIKKLWWNENQPGFFTSETMSTIVQKVPADLREKIFKHLNKSAPQQDVLNVQ